MGDDLQAAREAVHDAAHAVTMLDDEEPQDWSEHETALDVLIAAVKVEALRPLVELADRTKQPALAVRDAFAAAEALVAELEAEAQS